MFERKSNRLDSALLRASAPQYKDQMIMLLDDPLPNSKLALIIDALGWSEDAAVLPTLERANSFNNSEMRSAALRAAAKIGHPGAAQWVMQSLDDPVSFVRVQAANSCASLGLRDAIPQLLRLKDDDDLWVRLRAQYALDALECAWPNDAMTGAVA